MNKIILTLAIGSLLLYSCGNSSSEKTNNQTETATQNEHHHDELSETLKLNSGEKWGVNEEMKPFILEANELLQQYIANQSTDYQSLAAQLKEKNSELIKSCTMKGESHDELHKWLHPHMELIENLLNASNSDEAEDIITELKKSFKSYHNYFK